MIEPNRNRCSAALLLGVVLAVAGCAGAPAPSMPAAPDWAVSVHRDGDDLLTAGLGLAGLRNPLPPAIDADAPSAAELRRRAVWSNWRGIADAAPGGGLGEHFGEFSAVPGREFDALRRVPGAGHPHRVMLQLPDDFDRERRCLVVAASSGSRGIYGAISLAGGWGLPRGCAVAYTDKGGGTDWFDRLGGRGNRLDGTPGTPGDGLAFAPAGPTATSPHVLVKHMHSGDNPEADWGRHVQQAAAFAFEVLNATRAPGEAPYQPGNTRVLAVGLSNGGGAVLRAAELHGDWLDGVVAVAPNVHVAGARPLYDVATLAALWMPCALAAPAFDDEPLARPGGLLPPTYAARCTRLQRAGELQATTLPEQGAEALRQLQAQGWTERALAAATLSVNFDLWRAVAAGYAAAYSRSGSGPMPCGYDYAMLDPAGTPRLPTAAEQALWWSDSSGIPPAAGVALIESGAKDPDPTYPALRCLRALWQDDNPRARRLRAGVEATRAELPVAGRPVLVMHGVDDGLVPEAHTSAPYAAAAQAAGRSVRYWRIDHAQHFDAFLGLPQLGSRYLPLLPYAWHGMDAMWAHIADGAALPMDAQVTPVQRGIEGAAPKPLTREALRLP